MSRRCAGADNRKVWSAEAISHRDLTCRNIEDHFWDEERIEPRGSITSCIIHYLFLESDQSADTTGENYTCTIRVNRTIVNAGIFDGFVSSNEGQLSEPVHLAGFLTIKNGYGIKVFNFAGKPGFEFCSIK